MLVWLVALQLQVAAPRAPSVVVDGMAAPGEWTAPLQPLAGGSIVIQHDGASLFVRVDGVATGIAHLCVLRGDTVHVLHASASLGSARYVRRGEAFAMESGFTWAVRDRGGVPDSASNRARYRQEHGWTASTVAQSARVHEFAVDASWFGVESRLAVALLVPGRAAVVGWPASGAGGCDDLPLAMGTPPGSMRFATADWAQVKLEP